MYFKSKKGWILISLDKVQCL